jgi:hydroxyacylglutathione hydrolase
VAAAAAGFDAQVRQQDPASVLAGLRQWKNVF